MFRWLTIGLLLLPAVALANPFHEQLMSFPDAKREYVLKHLITDYLGQSCSRAVETLYVGSYKDDAMWDVRCRSGEQWRLLIKNDAGGTTTISDCRDLKAVGIECFKKLPEPKPGPKKSVPKKTSRSQTVIEECEEQEFCTGVWHCRIAARLFLA